MSRYRPVRPCLEPGCTRQQTGKYCPEHAAAVIRRARERLMEFRKANPKPRKSGG